MFNYHYFHNKFSSFFDIVLREGDTKPLNGGVLR